MSETYVIRRRKANGKGWEYLGANGNDFTTLPNAWRFSGPPKSGVFSREQVCRMVPTVRWFVNGTDGELCFGSSHRAHRYLNKWRHLTRGLVVKRTTYRPEPVK